MNQVDQLIEGLQILKKYSPDMNLYSTQKTRRVLEVQEIELKEISDQDKNRLLELGWWTNEHYVWGF